MEVWLSLYQNKRLPYLRETVSNHVYKAPQKNQKDTTEVA